MTYRNLPGSKLNVAASNIYIGFDDLRGYQGFTNLFQARALDQDKRGTPIYPDCLRRNLNRWNIARFRSSGLLTATTAIFLQLNSKWCLGSGGLLSNPT